MLLECIRKSKDFLLNKPDIILGVVKINRELALMILANAFSIIALIAAIITVNKAKTVNRNREAVHDKIAIFIRKLNNVMADNEYPSEFCLLNVYARPFINEGDLYLRIDNGALIYIGDYDVLRVSGQIMKATKML